MFEAFPKGLLLFAYFLSAAMLTPSTQTAEAVEGVMYRCEVAEAGNIDHDAREFVLTLLENDIITKHPTLAPKLEAVLVQQIKSVSSR